jgi:hypothetical protein
VQWDPKNHWQAVGPHPTFTVRAPRPSSRAALTSSAQHHPIISGSAQFQSQGAFTLKPTVVVHIDNLFSSSLVIDPTVNMQATGDAATAQLCATLGYDISMSISAELDINIGWLDIHEDKTFGPKSLYASGPQTIGHWCVHGN